MLPAQTRPRRGQVWADKLTAMQVTVEFRRKTRPMARVRPHSDMCWSMVAWSATNGGGIMHEQDFVKAFAFVGEPRVAS